MSLASVGSVALWGAITASGFSVAGSLLKRRRVAIAALWLAASLAAISTTGLVVGLVTSDFSLEYVVRTTSLSTPLPYRLAALWGAMEGSLLFYATMTLVVSVTALARIEERHAHGARPVVGVVGGVLLLLTAVLADPFATLDIPAVDGEGLLAILQHPAMVYHPPILYLGLTSLLLPFAVTISATRRNGLDREWVAVARRWMLISWTILTIGIVAGANWAYVELGWGGFWAWDPVENTSLMPWLVATVFLHTSLIQLRDGRLARWNVAIAMVPFTLTVLGVYLTRSGITGSVHAFAESDRIGRVLLTLFLFVVGLVVWQGVRSPPGENWGASQLSGRDVWLATQAALLGVVAAFVLVGSAYPAYIAVFTGAETSVDPRFFVTMILPITFLIIVGVALAMRTRWSGGGDELRAGWRHLGLVLVASLAFVFALLGFSMTWGYLLLVLAIGGGLLLVADLIRRRPTGRLLMGYLAHLGFAMVLIGAAGSSLGDQFRGGMAPGDVVRVGGYEVRLDRVDTGEEGRFIFVAADLSLLKNGEVVAEVRPQIRAYEDQPLPVPEPVLRSTPGEDIVFAISRVNQDASGVNVSVFVKPLVFWVWFGGLMIAVGGLVGLIVPAEGGGVRRRVARAAQPSQEATSEG